MPKIDEILGYHFSSDNLQSNVTDAWKLVESGVNGRTVACLNPHSIVLARSDDLFSEALHNCDILLPDGYGIVLGARILGNRLFDRVAGFEFFAKFSESANSKKNVRYYFMGSTKLVLSRISAKLAEDYPNICLCGTVSPPFKEAFSVEESNIMIDDINRAQPTVLWVGMTAPKQEKWIHENKDKLNVPLIVAVGAVFDFYAGTRKRAPLWMRNLGLEWLARFLREPVRLFRRNFVSSPVFIAMLLKERFRR